MNSKKTIGTGSMSYKELVYESLLLDPQEAIGDLREGLKDEDPRVFLLTVQDILEAYKGFLPEEITTELARLYYLLAENGGERFIVMKKLLDTFEIKLPPQAVEQADAKRNYRIS